MADQGRFAEFVDAAMEVSVVGGFSRIGRIVRGRVEHWSEPPSLAGRACLVNAFAEGGAAQI